MATDRYIEALRATSRTFFIPITRLPAGLREAVGSAYLCMRAVDEIEDHRALSPAAKASLLRGVSAAFQSANGNLSPATFEPILVAHGATLPEVTMDLAHWALLAPTAIAYRVWDATAAMAHRMAGWVEEKWAIVSEADLDRYTYAVAGAVGLLLSDLWAWHDGTVTNRYEAVSFGRGLQAVNIARNRQEDLARGVDFYPEGWNDEDMHAYCRRNLALAERYTSSLPEGPVHEFCSMPLALAHGTLDALERGEEKLTREQVLEVVQDLLD
jgi:farnesyl-diphosphate farnesyltransferase